MGMYTNQFLAFPGRMVIAILLMCSTQIGGCHSEGRSEVAGALKQVAIEPTTHAGLNRFGPQWSRGLVWYQVFPERFANENQGNDPSQRQSTTVAWEQSVDAATIEEVERGWMLAQGEPRHFGYDPSRVGGAVANVIYQRRYGGDLQGVLAHLDDLKEMGVGGIYLCPIFSSTSLHKYDAMDHRHIDPTLGYPGRITELAPTDDPDMDPADESTWDWTPADRWFLDVLVPAIHERGMKIMLDGVWNHVGLDHWAFQDVVRLGQSSVYRDWFNGTFDDEGRLVGWESWGGHNGRLPVFKQTKSGDLAPGPKAHMMAVTRRWMDPNNDGDPSDGIDGWRLDVANEIGRPFWKDWRTLVKGLNPEALIVGEIWHDAREYFDGTAFDAQMNYPAAYAIADWLSIGHMKGDAASVAARLAEVYSHDPETDASQLNLMSSHDTERLASLMQNNHQRSFDNGSHPWRDADTYDRDTVSEDAVTRALVAYMVLVASPGSPMIYNGDEFGMAGADDPDDRRPIPIGYLDGSTLNAQQKSFRGQVRWIMTLKQDPVVGQLLRLGQARWESSGDGKGLRIIRENDHQRLTIDIGPCDTVWGSAHDTNPVWAASRLLGTGTSCWEVELRLISTRD